jgi:hypothetical protein
MAQILTVTEDGTVILDKVALKYTSGSVIHSGFLQVTGNAQIDSNLVVQGNIIAKVITVDSIVTSNGSLAAAGQWSYNSEEELNGKGFSWTYGGGSVQLIYRSGDRLWTNANLDLAAGSALSIDNIPVITSTELGGSITSSNLTSVGTLESLAVSGNVNVADFVYVDSISNRIGVGTDEPNLSLSILDNNVELGMSSPAIGVGSIGTYSSHDLIITTDNLPRITIKSSGQVNIGDPVNGGGSLNVYGTLFATTVQTDNRIDRSFPMQFTATADTSIYGLGLTWVGTGETRQLIMMSNPDRLWSTESIDLGPNKAYYINGTSVINENGLGPTVLSSNLSSVGTLNGLHVSGVTELASTSASSLAVGPITLTDKGITSTASITVDVNSQKILSADAAQISIGDSGLQSKPVKIFGPLSVNINNPDPNLQFAVNGDVSIGGKKFTNGIAAPTTGSFQVGDMCWNSAPTLNSYVGWICVTAGVPGQWAPFGMIG